MFLLSANPTTIAKPTMYLSTSQHFVTPVSLFLLHPAAVSSSGVRSCGLLGSCRGEVGLLRLQQCKLTQSMVAILGHKKKTLRS